MSQPHVDRIAILGAGKMGKTLIRALLESGRYAPEALLATGRQESDLERVRTQFGVETTLDNCAAVQQAGLVILCVKPQGTANLLEEIRACLDPRTTLVSIAAGVSTVTLEQALPAGVPVVRAMPNTPLSVGAGMTALCAGVAATEDHMQAAQAIFSTAGRTLVLSEDYIDAVTGLSASGPAFVYIVIEALAEGGVKAGLPRAIATELAAQACLGASSMVLETGNHPALLRDDVTTPAGCTMDGILALEEGGLRVTLIKAVSEAARRAGELG